MVKKRKRSSKSNKLRSKIFIGFAVAIGCEALRHLFSPFQNMLAADNPVHAWHWWVDFCDHRMIPHLIVTLALLWMYEKVKQQAIKLAM